MPAYHGQSDICIVDGTMQYMFVRLKPRLRARLVVAVCPVRHLTRSGAPLPVTGLLHSWLRSHSILIYDTQPYKLAHSPTDAMYIPFQTVFASSLISMGLLKDGNKVSSGSLVDYCEKKCVNGAGDQACSVPFLVRTLASESHCYAPGCCLLQSRSRSLTDERVSTGPQEHLLQH